MADRKPLACYRVMGSAHARGLLAGYTTLRDMTAASTNHELGKFGADRSFGNDCRVYRDRSSGMAVSRQNFSDIRKKPTFSPTDRSVCCRPRTLNNLFND
jgi:hypothetical protein